MMAKRALSQSAAVPAVPELRPLHNWYQSRCEIGRSALQWMQEVIAAMDSFFLMGARPLVEGSPSMKLHELLDWRAIAAQLKGL